MAGVKTKREGVTRATAFEPVPCFECGSTIEKGADAWRVLVIKYKARSSGKSYVWKHKKCVNTGGK